MKVIVVKEFSSYQSVVRRFLLDGIVCDMSYEQFYPWINN